MITEEHALRAMSRFLREYLDRTDGAGQIAEVLADIEFERPMETSDPAAWFDWLGAVSATATTDYRDESSNTSS